MSMGGGNDERSGRTPGCAATAGGRTVDSDGEGGDVSGANRFPQKERKGRSA